MRRPLVYFFGVVILLSITIIGSFYWAYEGKIFAGVSVNRYPLGNRTLPQTTALLGKYYSAYEANQLLLNIDEHKVKLRQSDLGYYYDPVKTANNAYAVGRTGSPIKRLKDIYIASRRGITITPAYTLSSDKLGAQVQQLSRLYSDQALSAVYIFDNGKLQISPSVPGRVVDQSRLKNEIINHLVALNFRPIEVPMRYQEPEVTSAHLKELKPQVEDIVSTPFKFKYHSRYWQPTPNELLSFINVKPPSSNSPPAVMPNEGSIQRYVENIGKEVNVLPSPGVFKMNGGKVTEFSLPRDGLEVITLEAVKGLSENLITQESLEVELRVQVTEAFGGANNYGIRELLGEGTTQFRGSSSGRIHNIGLAASRVSGALVPPGEVFSFNDNVGDISAATGYDQAYIIADRRTVLGTGGGVCQVSTTVFRAAFNSGMEIVERYPHSYRVGYYEPAGLDATVYSPYTDLKFRNNTPSYILVYSYFDPGSSVLTFKVFGTDDGREVIVEGPSVVAGAQAPEPLYEEDPSLAPGEVKQVDFAIGGASATVRRLVTRGGETLIDEVIKSSYSPWQAIYKVGPED